MSLSFKLLLSWQSKSSKFLNIPVHQVNYFITALLRSTKPKSNKLNYGLVQGKNPVKPKTKNDIVSLPS